MEQVLSGLHWKALLVYLDNIIIISSDFSTHVSRLREVFDRFRPGSWTEAEALLQPEVMYLGHVVGRDGVTTVSEKVQAVKKSVVPCDLPELRAFLGLVGYYRQYIPGFAGVAQPLNRLTAKGVRWKWTQEEQKAFDHLKQRLMEVPILAYPDPAKKYILDTDPSDHIVGAVLSQSQGGSEVVMAYYSKTLAAQ